MITFSDVCANTSLFSLALLLLPEKVNQQQQPVEECGKESAKMIIRVAVSKNGSNDI